MTIIFGSLRTPERCTTHTLEKLDLAQPTCTRYGSENGGLTEIVNLDGDKVEISEEERSGSFKVFPLLGHEPSEPIADSIQPRAYR
jgi:hypothetical protein